MTLIDPHKIVDDQRARLNEQFPERSDRIDELAQHSVRELAEYVRGLVEGTPPNEDWPRWRIYGWALMPVEHYGSWAKWMLIQRILVMEKHDSLRLAGKPVPGLVTSVRLSQDRGAGPVQPPRLEDGGDEQAASDWDQT